MGITFEHQTNNSCCLCGSPDDLTGEHKVKASALRLEFGTDQMVIGRFETDSAQAKLAQSVKSKAFHFAARICRPCNSSRTQAADREFDHFHRAARTLVHQGKNPSSLFEDARYRLGSEAYLNVFRYFAKLLCCHLAEIGAPRPVQIANFAIGRAGKNCIWLSVDKDWTYEQVFSELGPHQYAAHGGLVIYADRKSGEPNAFHSTLTVGSLRYIFFSRMNWIARLELKFAHPVFYKWCRARVGDALASPMTETERLMLGLSDSEQDEKRVETAAP